MTGLNTKQTTAQLSFDLINEKLDTIITLLGGAPPTPTATLDDLLAELVLIRTDTGNIHLDTISMDQKLLSIRNYIKNPAEEALVDDYTSLMYNIMWIRRAVAASTFSASLDYPMQTELHDFKVNDDILITTTNNLFIACLDTMVHAFTNLGLQSGASPSYVYNGWLAQVINWLAKISASEGVPFDGGNRNIIQLLAKMADRPESTIGSGLIPTEVCIDAYVSTGMILVPGVADPFWPNLIYAKFGNTPPAGIEYGSIFGIGTDYTELVSTAGDWDGFWIYVASSTDNFGTYTGINTDDSLARYPTNVWVSLNGYDQHLAVFVPGDASVKVYICGGGWAPSSSSGGPWGGDEPVPPSEGECFEIDSVPAEYFYNPGFTLDMQVVQFSSIPGVSCTDSQTFTESTEGFDVGCTVALGNFVGWTIELLEGVAPLTIAMVSDSGSRTTDTISSSIYTIPFNTASFLLCNASQGGSAAGNPFTARICTPTTT